MKTIMDLFKAISGIATAVLIYITASRAAVGEDGILLLCVLCVLAIAVFVLSFAVSSLETRVKNLEDTLGIYVDRGYEDSEPEQKTCKNCFADVSADYVVCPYCGTHFDDTGDFGNPYIESISEEQSESVEDAKTGDNLTDIENR